MNQSGVFDPDEKFVYPGINHRAEPVIMEAEERIKGFDEVEGCLDLHQAYAEANRCLRCYKIAVAAL